MAGQVDETGQAFMPSPDDKKTAPTKRCLFWRLHCPFLKLISIFGCCTTSPYVIVSMFLRVYAVFVGLVLLTSIVRLLASFESSASLCGPTFFRVMIVVWQTMSLLNFAAIHIASYNLPVLVGKVYKIRMENFQYLWNRRPKYMTIYAYFAIGFIAVFLSINVAHFTLHGQGKVELPIVLNEVRNVSFPWPLVVYEASISTGINYCGPIVQTLMLTFGFEGYRCFEMTMMESSLTMFGIMELQSHLQAVRDVMRALNDIWSWYNLITMGFLVVAGCVILSVIATVTGLDSAAKFGFIVWLGLLILMSMMLSIPIIIVNEKANQVQSKVIEHIVSRQAEWRRSYISSNSSGEFKARLEDDQYHYQVELLLQLASVKDTEITAGNFFPITRMSILTLYSLIATYFVLILQFSAGSD